MAREEKGAWGRNEPWGGGRDQGFLSGEIQLTSLAGDPRVQSTEEGKNRFIFRTVCPSTQAELP